MQAWMQRTKRELANKHLHCALKGENQKICCWKKHWCPMQRKMLSWLLSLLLLLHFLTPLCVLNKLMVVIIIVVSPIATIGTTTTPMLNTTVICFVHHGFSWLRRIVVNNVTFEVALNFATPSTSDLHGGRSVLSGDNSMGKSAMDTSSGSFARKSDLFLVQIQPFGLTSKSQWHNCTWKKSFLGASN